MTVKTTYGRRWSWTRRDERGVVLVLAVFAVALLLVLSVGLTTAVRAELLASHTNLTRSQSLFLAEAGISQARAILLYEDVNTDTLQDDWGPEADEPLDAPYPLSDGFYRVRVYDACGRLDVNDADFPTLVRLTGDAALAQAIVDWRGQSQETEYYRSLRVPYAPRKGAFQTLGELLLVRGMAPDVYFGTPARPGLRDLLTVASASPNITAEGKPRVGLNEPSSMEEAELQSILRNYGGAITKEDLDKIVAGSALLRQQNAEYTSLAQLVSVARFYQVDDLARVIDYFTAEPPQKYSGSAAPTSVYGKVNANTAPVEVLAALPGSSAALADAIVKEREKQPFATLGPVVKLMYSNGGDDTFEQMIGFLTTKSSCFVIDAMGYTETGHGFRRLQAFVYRDTRLFWGTYTPAQVHILHQTEEDSPLPPPLVSAVQNLNSRRSRVAPS
jgi:general secretion pathway protein K